MHILYVLLVTFFAGMGAGLGTGFAGMSAAAVISPMLITFLHMDPYMAVGIALSSDVLASAVSAYTYHKNKNLDLKNGLIMMASVLVFTVVGSWVASKVPSATMGGFSVFMTFLLGVKFILRPVMTTKEAMQGVSAKKRAVQSVVCGVLIGFICGFIGAGVSGATTKVNHTSVQVSDREVAQVQTVKVDGKVYGGEIVYTGPLDELFNLDLGALPYRTLDMKFETLDMDQFQPVGTVNYTTSEDYTRITIGEDQTFLLVAEGAPVPAGVP